MNNVMWDVLYLLTIMGSQLSLANCKVDNFNDHFPMKFGRRAHSNARNL